MAVGNIPQGDLDTLIAEFGQQNVEEALIFIMNAKDFSGRAVMIRPTANMVRDVLEAVHGRLGVNEYRIHNLVPGFPKAWR